MRCTSDKRGAYLVLYFGMTKSSSSDAPTKKTEGTSTPSSATLVILATALDTTWRAFVPTLGGVFAGIGLDHLFGIAPVATIICLALGVVISALLIAKQLRDVRKVMK